MTVMKLSEFKKAYLEKQAKRSGKRHPAAQKMRVEMLRKQQKQANQAIKDGKLDAMLNKCAITGKRGKFGEDIKPAIVKVSKDGGFDRMKVLVHESVQQCVTYKGRTILSVKRDKMGATIKTVQMGLEIRPYVHIYEEKADG